MRGGRRAGDTEAWDQFADKLDGAASHASTEAESFSRRRWHVTPRLRALLHLDVLDHASRTILLSPRSETLPSPAQLAKARALPSARPQRAKAASSRATARDRIRQGAQRSPPPRTCGAGRPSLVASRGPAFPREGQ